MKLRLALVVVAVAGALLPLPPGFVERWYSSGVYLTMQPVVTGFSNQVSFALFDLVVLGVATLWIVAMAWDRFGRSLGWGSVFWRALLRTMTWAAVLYIAFLAVWGLNYRRVPLWRKVPFDASRVSPERAQALLGVTVDRLNALHDPAHAVGWRGAPVDAHLADAFARAIVRVGVVRAVRPGRPKVTVFQWYFRRAAVEGLTDPFFLETLVNSDLLPFERPLVEAHEWAHLAGFADEGEANFIGWLTCLVGGDADQYSGWLFLYGEAAAAVPRETRDREAARLDPGPRGDLRAIADRLRRDTSPRLAAAGWRVYDRYLRANRIAAGAASYADVVRLILGTGTGGV
jgi:Protein of unknown function (DUF3810)